jgi:hypothetical protein
MSSSLLASYLLVFPSSEVLMDLLDSHSMMCKKLSECVNAMWLCAIQKYYYCLISRFCVGVRAHEGGRQSDCYCYVIAIQSVNKLSCSFMMSFGSNPYCSSSSTLCELQAFEKKELRTIFRLHTDEISRKWTKLHKSVCDRTCSVVWTVKEVYI